MPSGDCGKPEVTQGAEPSTPAPQLPSSWTDYFARHGATPTGPGDLRRFPRIYFRGVAAVELGQSLPGLARARGVYKIYTKDISRTGVGFLHFEQLFPGEQMMLLLPNQIRRLIEVVRCRRVAERCFEVGAIFIKEFRTPAPTGSEQNGQAAITKVPLECGNLSPPSAPPQDIPGRL